MDKCRAASSVSKIRRSTLVEPTAKRHHKLVINNDDEDIINQEEEEEVMKNKNMMSGLGVNLEFIKLLKRGEVTVESLTLPPLGLAIDGIALPDLPPIKTLRGKVISCSPPFEKQLTTTDLAMSQGRLSFCKMAVDKLLKPMLRAWEDLITGIDVTVYDENGRGFDMIFKYWAGKMHLLARGWKIFCLEKELKACEDWVTIWMFRHKYTNGICFAIIRRRFPITTLIGKAQKRRSRSVVTKE